MKTDKQKKQRKDYERKHNINRNISDKTRMKNKGYVQPYPESHKSTKSKKK